MQVWDDQVRIECPREKLDRPRNTLLSLAGMPPDIERHAGLVAALIEAGELAPKGLPTGWSPIAGVTPAPTAAPPRWSC